MRKFFKHQCESGNTYMRARQYLDITQIFSSRTYDDLHAKNMIRRS